MHNAQLLEAVLQTAKRAGHLIELVLSVLHELADLAHLIGGALALVTHCATITRGRVCQASHLPTRHDVQPVSAHTARPLPSFELQFPIEEIPALAARFPAMDERPGLALGVAARSRGHYTRSEFISVCGWKTARSRPKVAANSEAAVVDATGRAMRIGDEAARIAALLELEGVGVPTASTLLYFAFPDDYPILDVRALESLGTRPRSVYPISFWLAYLGACRTLSRRAGVSLRTLDKALWQHSKERSAGGS